MKNEKDKNGNKENGRRGSGSADGRIRRLSLCALFAAVIFTATAFLPRIPISQTGYAHLGDAFIYAAACLLPFPYGLFAAAIGGAAADIASGYAFYAAFTFVSKALLTLPFSSKGGRMLTKRNVIASVLGIPVTFLTYLVPDTVLTGSFASAAAAGVMNVFQGIVSAALFIAAGVVLDKAGVKKHLDI